MSHNSSRQLWDSCAAARGMRATLLLSRLILNFISFLNFFFPGNPVCRPQVRPERGGPAQPQCPGRPRGGAGGTARAAPAPSPPGPSACRDRPQDPRPAGIAPGTLGLPGSPPESSCREAGAARPVLVSAVLPCGERHHTRSLLPPGAIPAGAHGAVLEGTRGMANLV